MTTRGRLIIHFYDLRYTEAFKSKIVSIGIIVEGIITNFGSITYIAISYSSLNETYSNHFIRR